MRGLLQRAPTWIWLAALACVSLALLGWGEGRTVLALLVSSACLFVLPGGLLAGRLLRGRETTWTAFLVWGGPVGASLVILAMTAASLVPVNLSGAFWTGYSLLGVMLTAGVAWPHRQDLARRLRLPPRLDLWQALLVAGTLLAVWCKLGSVAHLLVPPLHDPASHSLMARLVADHGHVPWTQMPFRDGPFFYPPGLAALVAVWHGVSGLSIPAVVLLGTHLLSILAGLVLALTVRRATSSGAAGLLAFILWTYVSIMPDAEYYMAGKNASVSSNLFFIATLLAFQELRRPHRGMAVVAGLLTSACLVTHYEKAYFLALFLLALGVTCLLGGRKTPWRQHLLDSLIALSVAGVSFVPWGLHLLAAVQGARSAGVDLVPTDPDPYAGASLTWDACKFAVQSYWTGLKQFAGKELTLCSLLAPLGLFAAGNIEALPIVLFTGLMWFFHPGVVEPLGLSLAKLSYDRITVHFAYLPVCMAAAIGAWGVWRLVARTGHIRSVKPLRVAGIVVMVLGILVGAISRFGVYSRASVPWLDRWDVAAIAWTERHVPVGDIIVTPVDVMDRRRGRFLLGGLGLYVPVLGSHDSLCHFIRIETSAIEREYARYERLLLNGDFEAARGAWFVVRDDQAPYAALARRLAGFPKGWVQERHHEGPVRILLAVGPSASDMKAGPGVTAGASPGAATGVTIR